VAIVEAFCDVSVVITQVKEGELTATLLEHILSNEACPFFCTPA